MKGIRSLTFLKLYRPARAAKTRKLPRRVAFNILVNELFN